MTSLFKKQEWMVGKIMFNCLCDIKVSDLLKKMISLKRCSQCSFCHFFQSCKLDIFFHIIKHSTESWLSIAFCTAHGQRIGLHCCIDFQNFLEKISGIGIFGSLSSVCRERWYFFVAVSTSSPSFILEKLLMPLHRWFFLTFRRWRLPINATLCSLAFKILSSPPLFFLLWRMTSGSPIIVLKTLFQNWQGIQTWCLT